MSQVPDEKLERREVFYSGRVQGVGFRFTARGLAERYGLVGYVKNLPDGRVELVAEGEASVLNKFFAAITDELEKFIRGQQSRTLPSSGEYYEFEIRH